MRPCLLEFWECLSGRKMAKTRLLLDTHVFLWWRANDRRLVLPVRDAIATADSVFVSAASAWEAAIKISLGRLSIPGTMESGVEESGFEKLPILFSHAEAAGALPAHHQDPFDRMLIAQALVEKLTLVSRDRRMAQYDVPIIWA
jgi:PIN domain nuclease of toxin-antitoxin system